jgi:hypothetical protein
VLGHWGLGGHDSPAESVHKAQGTQVRLYCTVGWLLLGGP